VGFNPPDALLLAPDAGAKFVCVLQIAR
jgi:hypothetical protein